MYYFIKLCLQKLPVVSALSTTAPASAFRKYLRDPKFCKSFLLGQKGPRYRVIWPNEKEVENLVTLSLNGNYEYNILQLLASFLKFYSCFQRYVTKHVFYHYRVTEAVLPVTTSLYLNQLISCLGLCS